MSNARAELAASINTRVKTVVDNYVNSRESQNREEIGERYEALAREVVDQQLTGTKTICEKMMKVNSTGNYKCYVAIELSAQELLSAYNERLTSDERLRVDYATSVSTLREILNRLASEGLVAAEGQKGFEVAPVSVADLREVAEMRLFLEHHALELSLSLIHI